MSRLELRIPPLALLALCAIAMAALPEFVAVPWLAFPGHASVAVLACVAGVTIAAAGVLEFRRAGTTVNPLEPVRSSSVVVTGVYRWTRNPMYLGMAVLLLGLAVWRATLPGYAIVPLFCAWLNRFQIVPEERVLLATFGAEFSSYMSRVRRWV